MRLLQRFSVAAIVIAAGLSQTALAQKSRPARTNSPQSVVQSFYRFHLAHDIGFTRRNVELRRRWLTPELYAALRDEFRKQAEEAKKHPDEAPYINGDPFTDSQDTPNSFRLAGTTQSGETAVAQVVFVWGTGGEGAKRTVSVTLRKVGARWLIGNVKSEGGEDLLTLLRKPRE